MMRERGERDTGRLRCRVEGSTVGRDGRGGDHGRQRAGPSLLGDARVREKFPDHVRVSTRRRAEEVVVVVPIEAKIGHALGFRHEGASMTTPLSFQLGAEPADSVVGGGGRRGGGNGGGGGGGAQELGVEDARDGTTLLPQGREEGDVLGGAVSLPGRQCGTTPSRHRRRQRRRGRRRVRDAAGTRRRRETTSPGHRQ